MSRVRQTTSEVVFHTTWMFGIWAAARVVLGMYMRRDTSYPDLLLKFATDVEIHSLSPRWGWDLAVFILFAVVAGTVQARRHRPVLVSVALSTLFSVALAVAMAMYPALTLSGRLGSPFSGIDRSLHETITFAVVVTAVLAIFSTVLILAGHRRAASRSHS